MLLLLNAASLQLQQYLRRAWKELSYSLQNGIGQSLGGKADDQSILCQTGQVLDHTISFILQPGKPSTSSAKHS